MVANISIDSIFHLMSVCHTPIQYHVGFFVWLVLDALLLLAWPLVPGRQKPDTRSYLGFKNVGLALCFNKECPCNSRTPRGQLTHGKECCISSSTPDAKTLYKVAEWWTGLTLHKSVEELPTPHLIFLLCFHSSDNALRKQAKALSLIKKVACLCECLSSTFD